MLLWAIERAHLAPDELTDAFPALPDWIEGKRQPTLKQLERFARTVHAPVGYLVVPTPPDERLPIPDFRRRRPGHTSRPSADLLDTIHLCERRQAWYREYVRRTEQERLPFVGSLSLQDSNVAAAERMRAVLGLTMAARAKYASWSDALRGMIDNAESAGVLVMVSGIVGSNTHRVLDPDEFGGFSLVGDFAPVVFINGSDTKAAQIFTLAHELAHVWLGESAVSDAPLGRQVDNNVEVWCNAVAAEFLVPASSFLRAFRPGAGLSQELQRLADEYRVSTLVILRRARDAGFLTWEEYGAAYVVERDRLVALQRPPTGGDFIATAPVRASRRFTKAVLASTLEGQTLYRDAFRLLGFRKTSTFEKLRQRLGVA